MLEYFTAEHAESAENFFLNISHRGYRAHSEAKPQQKIYISQIPQRTQRGKAATKNLYLAEPTEDTEQKFIFFNIFFHLFLWELCELCESHFFLNKI